MSDRSVLRGRGECVLGGKEQAYVSVSQWNVFESTCGKYCNCCKPVHAVDDGGRARRATPTHLRRRWGRCHLAWQPHGSVAAAAAVACVHGCSCFTSVMQQQHSILVSAQCIARERGVCASEVTYHTRWWCAAVHGLQLLWSGLETDVLFSWEHSIMAAVVQCVSRAQTQGDFSATTAATAFRT